MNKKTRFRFLAFIIAFITVFCQFSLIFTDYAFADIKNLALNKSVEVSGYERGVKEDGTLNFPEFAKEHLTDGKLNTRWSSDTTLTELDLSKNPDQNEWAYVDLEQIETIAQVILRWQNAVARNYDIQISDDAETWTTIEHYERDETESGFVETVSLEIPVQARYVRVYARVGTSLANGYHCKNISLNEIEIYGEIEPLSALEAALSKITSSDPVLSEDGKSIILPDPGGASITASIFGSGNKTVVDMEGNVTQPLHDMEVNIFYEVSDEQGNSLHSNKANHITIPGKYRKADSINEKPNVVPGLREWIGHEGMFKLTGNIVLADETLSESAEMTAVYLKEMVDKDVSITVGTPAAGDIYFIAGENEELGYEGYEMEISDILTVAAPEVKGALYAGATITQILQQSEDKQSIPKGLVRDYPQYEVRSFMMDIARFYMPLDYLEEVVKYAAYYKINEVHLHINDNGGEQASAFRVESKKYPGINEGIIAYSQEDYKAFQKEVRKFGIDVVTEIDTPAHSGFVSKVRPDLVPDGYHIDLSNPESAAFIKELFDEFLDGEDPVFQGSKFHIGTDEYNKDYSETVRAYMDDMIKYVNGKGLETRFWASLGTKGFAGETPVSTDAVANLWSHGWASFSEMLDDGYKFINNADGVLYIVPGPAGYNNRLSLTGVYDNWEVSNLLGGYTLEAGHPQLLGAESCIWNDYKNGHSEFDYFDRVRVQLMLMSEKNWYGEKTEGQDGDDFAERVNAVDKFSPNANPARHVDSQDEVVAEYDFEDIKDNKAIDSSGNGYDATLNGLSTSNGAVNLDGKGYISLPFGSLGYPYTVSMDITIDKDTPANAVLFDGKDGTLYYNYDRTGKLGYVRKGYSYVIDFAIPFGVKMNLKLTCTPEDITLYIDGYQAGTGMYYKVEDAHAQGSSSFVLPTEKIASGIIGKLKNLKLYNYALSEGEIAGEVDFKYENLALHKEVEASGVEGGYDKEGKLVYPQFDPKHTVDGDKGTRVSLNRDDDAWLVVDLGDEYLLDKVQILFRETPKSYKILTSLDGEKYEEIALRSGLTGGIGLTETLTLDKLTLARYVKYQQIEMFTLQNGTKYSGNFTEFEVYGYETNQLQSIIDDAKASIAGATVTPENQEYIKKLESNISDLKSILAEGPLDNLYRLTSMIQKQTNDLVDGNAIVYDVDCSVLLELLNKNYSEYDFNEEDGRLYKNMAAYAWYAYYDINSTQEKIDYIVSVISELYDKGLYMTVWTNMFIYKDKIGYTYGTNYLCDGADSTWTWFGDFQEAGKYILFNFKDPFPLSSVQLLSPDAGVDVLAGGIVEVSLDNKTWTKVADVGGSENQTVTFDEIEAKMIRIVITKPKSKWLRLNEVRFNKRTLVDRTGLQNEVDNMIPGLDLTTDSYRPYKQAIEEAKELIASPDTYKAQVDKLLARIAQAKENFEKMDKTKLQALLEECVTLDKEDYTEGSWDMFYTYLENAQTVFGNGYATQVEISLAYDLLTTAKSFLVPISSEEVDKILLQIVVDLAQKAADSGEVDKAIESVQTDFYAAFDSAKAILENQDATQVEVDQAYENLTEMLNRLGFIKGDKTALQNMYDLLFKLNLRDYETGEAKEAFKTAMQKAADILADGKSLAGDINDAYAELILTSSKLVRIDRSRLAGEITISDIIKADLDKYVEAGQSEFKAALEAAKLVLDADEVTQAQIEEARSALATARANLRFKADKSILESLMATARSLDLGQYTDESVELLNRAKRSAQLLLDDESLSVADQKKVDDTAKILSDVLDLMQLKATDGSSSGGNGNSTNSDTSKAGNAAKTGDTTNTTIVLFAATALLGLAITLIILKRRNIK